jgi:hypothetical protein
MDNTAKKLKSIIKNPAGGKPPFGSNPMDPWSAKANISEASLDDYLSSRGINPKFISKDTKISHAKSSQFIKWQNDRKMVGESSESDLLARYLNSRGINPKFVTTDVKISHSKSDEFQKWKNDHLNEAVDKRDTVVLDIPLLIRILELAREDIKSDVDLHRVVERLIQIRKKGVLTMTDYKMIANISNIKRRHFRENHVAIAMGNMLDDEGSMVLNQIEELERGCAMIRDYIGKDYEKQLPAWVQSKVTLATDYMSTVGNYLASKNEDVKEAHDPWKDKHFGPTKIIKQKYHVKTDTKSYNVKADNEDHAHKLVTKHAPGSKIVSIEHKGRMMEEIEPIDEISKELTHSYLKKRYAQTGATRQDKPKGMSRTTHDKQLMGLNRATKRLTTTLELPKGTDPSQGGKYTADSVEIDGTPIQEGSAALRLAQALRKEREARELKDKSREAAEKNEKAKQPVQQQENTMDSLAATQAPYDGANTPDDVAPKDKNKRLIMMSKSARIIRSIYKRKGMKEETYDFEKDDKSSESKPYGKKPSFNATDKYKNAGENKPEAKAIMKGGTTLTGQPRDVVEIDPSMKNRPDRPDTFDKGNPKKSPV